MDNQRKKNHIPFLTFFFNSFHCSGYIFCLIVICLFEINISKCQAIVIAFLIVVRDKNQNVPCIKEMCGITCTLSSFHNNGDITREQEVNTLTVAPSRSQVV